jgi:hypothetical protein
LVYISRLDQEKSGNPGLLLTWSLSLNP